MTKYISILLVFTSFPIIPFPILNCQEKNTLKLIEHTIIFLGTQNSQGQPIYSATGFLVQVNKVFHLVTAKHVVMENINGRFTGKMIDQNLRAFFNDKNGKLRNRSLSEIKSQTGFNWVFHDSIYVDIAMIPFPIDTAKDDLIVIPDNFFLNTDRLFEVYDVFFLSFQPGLESATEIDPIFKTGTISKMRKDKTFYINAFAFPGNSGSPVFLRPSLTRFDETSVNIGGDILGNRFIGLVGEYLPYEEVAISAQTLRPRVVFEENTGLARVWSVSYIQEIMNSKTFQSQIQKIKF